VGAAARTLLQVGSGSRMTRSSLMTAVAAVVVGGAAAPALGQVDPLAVERPPAEAATGEPAPVEWLRLTTAVGYQRIALRTFVADRDALTAELVPETLHGPVTGLGLGAKLWFVSVGVTGRLAWLSGAGDHRGDDDVRLWSVDGEVALRAPLGRLEPFVLLGAGYSSLDDAGDVIEGLDQGLDIDGVNLRGGLGFDLYVNRRLSLDVRGTSDLLFLARKGVSARDLLESQEVGTLDEAEARILEAEGASAGLGFELTAGLGVHF
jgi:hypothetical protein